MLEIRTSAVPLGGFNLERRTWSREFDGVYVWVATEIWGTREERGARSEQGQRVGMAEKDGDGPKQ